ncbi:MAG: WGxxGxxG family protein [Longimicrobiales bacterium]
MRVSEFRRILQGAALAATLSVAAAILPGAAAAQTRTEPGTTEPGMTQTYPVEERSGTDWGWIGLLGLAGLLGLRGRHGHERVRHTERHVDTSTNPPHIDTTTTTRRPMP